MPHNGWPYASHGQCPGTWRPPASAGTGPGWPQRSPGIRAAPGRAAARGCRGRGSLNQRSLSFLLLSLIVAGVNQAHLPIGVEQAAYFPGAALGGAVAVWALRERALEVHLETGHRRHFVFSHPAFIGVDAAVGAALYLAAAVGGAQIAACANQAHAHAQRRIVLAQLFTVQFVVAGQAAVVRPVRGRNLAGCAAVAA